MGYSTMTVSCALNDQPNVNEKNWEIIKKKARSMGYTPNHVAKSLVSRKSQTIEVVGPEIAHVFFPEVIRGVEKVANDLDDQFF